MEGLARGMAESADYLVRIPLILVIGPQSDGYRSDGHASVDRGQFLDLREFLLNIAIPFDLKSMSGIFRAYVWSVFKTEYCYFSVDAQIAKYSSYPFLSCCQTMRPAVLNVRDYAIQTFL